MKRKKIGIICMIGVCICFAIFAYINIKPIKKTIQVIELNSQTEYEMQIEGIRYFTSFRGHFNLVKDEFGIYFNENTYTFTDNQTSLPDAFSEEPSINSSYLLYQEDDFDKVIIFNTEDQDQPFFTNYESREEAEKIIKE